MLRFETEPSELSAWMRAVFSQSGQGFTCHMVHYDTGTTGVDHRPGKDWRHCWQALVIDDFDLSRISTVAHIEMSPRPMYIDGKLLGAVAFAWPFDKEPIAEINQCVTMHLRRFIRVEQYRQTARRHAKALRRTLHFMLIAV